MSALLQGVPRREDGSISYTAGVAPPAYFHNGLSYEADGSLAVHINATNLHYHQGLPFDSSGRLGVGQGVVNHYGSGAAPFIGPDELAVIELAPNHYSSGVGYASNNHIAVTTAIIVLTPWSGAFSSAFGFG